MRRTFRQELQEDLTAVLSRLTLWFTSGILLALAVFVFAIQNYQLSKETDHLIQTFNRVEEQSWRLVDDLNEKIMPQFLLGKRAERELFSRFYEELMRQDQRGELILVDEKGERKWSSNNSWADAVVPSSYLNALVEQASGKGRLMRVTHLGKDRPYLVLASPVQYKSKLLGYTFLFLNGNDFLSHRPTEVSQFIIADQLDHVYSKSSDEFIKEPLGKVKADAFSSSIKINLREPLMLSQVTALKEGLLAYTYWRCYDLPLLLFWMSLLTLLTFGIMKIKSASLSKRLALRQSTSMAALVEEAQLVTSGRKNSIQMTSGDEFEYLADQLNKMIEAINKLYKGLLAVERQSLLFEKKMLEAQFNPHFLYNTLETIRVTMTFAPEIAEKLIFALNRIMRYSVSAEGTDTPLSEDLEIIEDYLSIYHVRFDHLKSRLSLEEELNSLLVPRLFLLPLIENALKYGLASRNDLEIDINIYQRENRLYVEVLDNGPGFSKQAVEKLKEHLYEKETHHGLVNTIKRFQLAFEGAEWQIKKENEWTMVRLSASLPKRSKVKRGLTYDEKIDHR
ncbi:hypothetical protein D3H64_07265 [Atopobacter sp. AH10]|uniref:sensor histidine kinase n=1 Tax=Atopobacter sp. AH10 TaxID=2315861 RepID=UPI000EF1C75C|nr:histidine kinase [Atopobacter sp. AH10]RLK62873.1 hypothetical protein D3H64_07265 [Atopobacter sp. AH10]